MKEKRQLSVFQPEQPPEQAPGQGSDTGCNEECCAPSNERGSGVEAPVRRTDGYENDTERTVIQVVGMDCASCAVTVERRVGKLSGVRAATVNFAAGRLEAEHDPDVRREEIEGAVEAAGYGVDRPREGSGTPFWRSPRVLSTGTSALLFAVGAALQLAGASELVRLVVYATAIVVGGLPIFRAALGALGARHMDMNVLMSAAVVGAAAIGAWGEAALVVVLFSAGNALQTYAVERTRNAVRALVKLAPDEVLVRQGEDERLVAVSEVEVGDTILVKPGQRLAVDGEIVEGETTLDEAPVTGESVPVEKGPGEAVFSGSLNGSGALAVRTTKEASESTLQRIARLVEEAQGTKAPAEQFADRFSRVYTPLVVTAAVVVAAAPPLLLGADFGVWLYRGLALLIIACPCSLVISTPVTVVSGIGAASRRGILIKGGAALEAAGRLEALAFDKTGTLTEGRPVVEQVLPLGEMDEDEALRLAAALERRSEHPLAHAILSASEARGRELPEVSGFRAVSGRGAEGEVEGRRYLVGSPRLFAERGISLENARRALSVVEEAGETPVILGTERGPLAVFGLADGIRPDAQRALGSLREAGVESLTMLTGDAEAPARRVARELGVDYRARLLPEQKVEAVRDLVGRHGTAGMVGDGINDAPALAASSVGFAMGAAGTDVSLETADVALMADDLPKLAAAVRLSQAAERIIKQNILTSILFKSVFVVLAPFGLVTLWLAVLADMATSIAVTFNGLRLFDRRHG